MIRYQSMDDVFVIQTAERESRGQSTDAEHGMVSSADNRAEFIPVCTTHLFAYYSV